MWKLTIEDDEGKQTALPLAHEEYSLGRGEANAIRLTDRNISRTHAVLKKNGQGWFVKDLQSYNGTFVNGIRVVGEQGIQSGDLVQIGDYRLELLDEAVVVAASSAPAAPPVHQRPNRLVVVVGPTPGAEFPLDKEHFTIGRSEEATISINHSSVSRVHAELIALGNGRYEIVDKQSANGIRINGVELKRGILEAGDALELGDVRLRFVGAGKIFRADLSQALGPAGTFASDPVSKPRPGLGIGKLVGIGALVGIAVIVGIVMLLRQPGGEADPNHPAVPQMSDDAARKQLDMAQEKLKGGDVDAAHKAALQIPESSPLRDDKDFKGIEVAWADSMFAKVDQTTDTGDKKKLLKEINATPSVDAEHRKKAAAMVADIEAKEPPPAAPTPVWNPADHPGGGSVPSSTASSKPDAPSGAGVPPQGLAGEDAQRKALEPKVFSGKGTVDEIRMLKAICSHLGNRDCRDRANALLKKKLEQQ